MTVTLAIGESQQSRVFFECQMHQFGYELVATERALQASGFPHCALDVEPRTAAGSCARLRAKVMAAEAWLQALRRSLANKTPGLIKQRSALTGLPSQAVHAEQAGDADTGLDHVSKHRESSYQKIFFALFPQQYELAGVDEGSECALIQVIDIATPAERKRWHKRPLMAGIAGIATFRMVAAGLLQRQLMRDPAQRTDRLRLRALRGCR